MDYNRSIQENPIFISMLLNPIEMDSLDIEHTGAQASKPILDCKSTKTQLPTSQFIHVYSCIQITKSREHWPDNNTGHLEIFKRARTIFA
jgi:hypothetical protein